MEAGRKDDGDGVVIAEQRDAFRPLIPAPCCSNEDIVARNTVASTLHLRLGPLESFHVLDADKHSDDINVANLTYKPASQIPGAHCARRVMSHTYPGVR